MKSKKIEMISQAERSNFLRQCWRTRRWKDGVGTLLLPLRTSVYHWRRDLMRSRRGAQVGIAPVSVAAKRAPAFSQEIHPIFCDTPSCANESIDLAAAFSEADSQLSGIYRFAGGRSGRFDLDSVEMRLDVEDVHAYHRLYWAPRYAVAASFGHKGAQQALLRDLPLWLGGRWDHSAIAAWPYTRAERIASLTAALFWIRQAEPCDLAPLVGPIKQQIWKDATQLCSNVEFALGVHNHLLNDARGLFLASAALASECEETDTWRDQAFDIWDEYFPQLVLEDGTFAEQSSLYHLLLCRTALEYLLACRRRSRAIAAGFEARVRAMFDLANELVRVDGSLPRFGDNSPDATVSDLSGLLAAAHHYGIVENPPRDRAITPLTIFYCGAPPKLPASTTAAPLRLFCKGGFAFLRSPAMNAELVAHGDHRDGVGAHGDAGRGSYELWWDGQVLVREPGSFFSSSDPRWRFYQSAEAQNVTSLNGLAPAITKQDEGYLARWYRPEGGAWEALANGGVQFRCDAFQRLHPDITLFRAWRFTEPDTLTFEEKIEGSARVQFESRICLGDAPWGALEKSSAPSLATLRCNRADAASAEMIIAAPENLAITEQPSSFLPEYGIEKSGRTLVLGGSQQLPFSWKVQWKLRKAA